MTPVAGFREQAALTENLVDKGNSGSLEVDTPDLSVIVPVYNEASTVDRLLRVVVASPLQKQVIVVDDGSTDGTSEVLAKWRQHADFEVVAHPINRGKGAAIRTALARARGHFTIIQDADLEYNPRDYERLLGPLMSGAATVVYGSRRLHRRWTYRQRSSVFGLGVCILNLCARTLYGIRLTDEATCYKVFPTEILRMMDLECERFEFCPEVTAKACRMGLDIDEVPIDYTPRGIRDGKKIRLRDGFEAIAALWRWRKWSPTSESRT